MAALSDSGFTQNLQFLKGQPPSIAVSGAGPNGLATIVCAQNHDVVLTLSSVVKSGSEIEANMTALATKLNQIMIAH
jgi:threonine dehydrogenase-like Zn-dependent dehydrogenase